MHGTTRVATSSLTCTGKLSGGSTQSSCTCEWPGPGGSTQSFVTCIAQRGSIQVHSHAGNNRVLTHMGKLAGGQHTIFTNMHGQTTWQDSTHTHSPQWRMAWPGGSTASFVTCMAPRGTTHTHAGQNRVLTHIHGQSTRGSSTQSSLICISNPLGGAAHNLQSYEWARGSTQSSIRVICKGNPLEGAAHNPNPSHMQGNPLEGAAHNPQPESYARAIH